MLKGSVEFYEMLIQMPMSYQERLALFYLVKHEEASADELAQWIGEHGSEALLDERFDNERRAHVRVVLHRLRKRLQGTGFTVIASGRGVKGGDKSKPARHRLIEEDTK